VTAAARNLRSPGNQKSGLVQAGARKGVQAFRKASNLHFVGIGGAGMCGIAEVLINMGFKVTGSDLKTTPVTERLVHLGGTVIKGHKKDNVHGSDVVVISSAVKQSNPEVMEARKLGIPVIARAEMLAELMRMKYGVAVAGSHGKTSTTSMAAHVIAEAGFDPTVVIGGRLGSLGGGARLGQGELMVAEADESDGSFLHLSPTIAIVTNVDFEHMDHYGSMDNLRDAFVAFLNKVPFYGIGVICLDDPEIQGLIPRLDRKLVTYGVSAQADLVANKIETEQFASTYDAVLRGEKLGQVRLNVPGRHNIYNSLAVVAVSLELDIPFADIAGGLASFEGADRRFQLRGTFGDGSIVVDDYAHHPTEIRATLSAAREGWSNRIIAVFQPHRYSRIQALAEEFSTSFYEADVVLVTPLYPAGEAPIEGVDAEMIYKRIQSHGHRDVRLMSSLTEARQVVKEVSRSGDIVLTMGAGDVNRICEELTSEGGSVGTAEVGKPGRKKGRRPGQS
jgi:UDP-N-acetylmuramate--alanine ligase